MEIVAPNISNFIISIRDVGYSLEIAIADIIDNSISAKAKKVEINFLINPTLKIEILDNGCGMDEKELIEAMRLGSKNPLEKRTKNDLGRFGLGLKTASFSQCKKLTVFSKKNNILINRQWDLDYLEKTNEWYLLKLNEQEIKYAKYEYLDKLKEVKNGTLVIWENIDRFSKEEVPNLINNLRNHLSLTFHKFIEKKDIFIKLNENFIKAFNPFNGNHIATQQLKEEIITMNNGEKIKILPYVLPHHSKVSQSEYEQYGTEEGYLKSQGFYLYRANRLLIHGTWFGLHKISEVHKLVRIQVDIPNTNDPDWGIDIKKSIAKPTNNIREQLRRIIKEITLVGSRVYTGRGKKIEDKSVEKFWNLYPEENGKISFRLNLENQLYKKILENLSKDNIYLLNMYLKYIQEYIPLNAILVQLQQNPHKVCQREKITDEEKKKLREKLLELGLNEEYLKKLEIFKE